MTTKGNAMTAAPDADGLNQRFPTMARVAKEIAAHKYYSDAMIAEMHDALRLIEQQARELAAMTDQRNAYRAAKYAIERAAPAAAPPEPAPDVDADAQMAAIRRVMLSRHPILMAIYDAVQAVEKCGASTELTDAVILTGKLSEQAATLLDTIERQAIEIAARDTHLESFRIGIRERDATILRLQKSHTQAWNISVRDAATIEQQARELAEWRTWGIVEVSIRNPSVAEYMRHWEGRAERAERDLAAARAVIAAADAMRESYFTARMVAGYANAPTPTVMTTYDAARAAIKETK